MLLYDVAGWGCNMAELGRWVDIAYGTLAAEIGWLCVTEVVDWGYKIPDVGW